MSVPPVGSARALVLDFDGLTVDSESIVFRAWRELYARYGQELTLTEWLQAVGHVGGFDPQADLTRRTGRDDLDWPRLDAELTGRVRADMLVQPALPGVEALLCRAAEAGWRRGVASNSTAGWVVPGLERLGLRGLVEEIRTREQVRRPKPAPDVYLAVLAALGADPARSVACEDSRPGVAAAKAAGLFVVAVPNALTRHQDLSEADVVVASLADYRLPD